VSARGAALAAGLAVVAACQVQGGPPLQVLTETARPRWRDDLPATSAIFDGATGGFLSALIIGFGMMQAWQQARQPSVVFEGPFRVGSAAS